MVNIVRVAHKVRYSFDLASCRCGWYDVSLNQDRLHVGGSAHEEAFWGHAVELEEFEPVSDE